jgi:hypothetical protein
MEVTIREAGASAANVLASTQVTCMLPVKDMARARRFDEDALGLVPLGAEPDGKFVYQYGRTELALFPKPEGTKAEHTALSFNRGTRLRARLGARRLVPRPRRQHPVPA